MKISQLSIKNFKSINELTLHNIDYAMIIVGKNSTGKSSILDAILAVAGLHKFHEDDFTGGDRPVEITVVLDITDDDLQNLHSRFVVSRYKRFDQWKKEFCEKLPTYRNGKLSFTYIASKNQKPRYTDGIRKNNIYIPMVLPKIYHIDTDRQLTEIQENIIMSRGQESLETLKSKACMFDSSRPCTHCYQCIGLIEQKSPMELSVIETFKLLEFKLVNRNIEAFIERLNFYFHKNNNPMRDIKYAIDFNMDELFRLNIVISNRLQPREHTLTSMSAGMKSIYIFSLLEAYIEEDDSIPCIIIMEDPEIYLHPQLQKTASDVLYRLSKKNQVIFSTHSPNCIFNFNSRQIKQTFMNEYSNTIVNEQTNIDEILNDLGYTANDFLNVSFVFIVEGKQDQNRLPLLLLQYYSELTDDAGNLRRIAIIPTNSCTNIETYANLQYINKLYLKDQFLMIRDGDGKDHDSLVNGLCDYYHLQNQYDQGSIPRVTERNVLVLKYYSFENYFLDPAVMAEVGIIPSEDAFYSIFLRKYKKYLHNISSMQKLEEDFHLTFNTKEDVKNNLELIKTYVRGHNLFTMYYARYKGEREQELLKKYIEYAPRSVFADILDPIDNFVYFDSRKKQDNEK